MDNTTITNQTNKLRKLSTRVANILIANPATRDDDNQLYYAVCADIAKEANINFTNLSFYDVMFGTTYKFPSFESVTRCRRKIQSEDNHLCGNRRYARLAMQTAYSNFATDDD